MTLYIFAYDFLFSKCYFTLLYLLLPYSIFVLFVHKLLLDLDLLFKIGNLCISFCLRWIYCFFYVTRDLVCRSSSKFIENMKIYAIILKPAFFACKKVSTQLVKAKPSHHLWIILTLYELPYTFILFSHSLLYSGEHCAVRLLNITEKVYIVIIIRSSLLVKHAESCSNSNSLHSLHTSTSLLLQFDWC